jgi:UDP-3-O-[3-hydroxymyristoyl] N-acetylglucosamine deacetylase
VDRGGAEIPLCLESVTGVEWATTLSFHGATVHTVEHLLAALYACKVDDVVVEIDGPELPACDGSARDFVKLIEGAGLSPRKDPVSPLTVETPIWLPGEGKHILAFPDDQLTITYAVDYGHPVIGKQCITLSVGADSFRAEIASARTFALSEWVEDLQRRGLGTGGSLANAVVVYPDRFSTDLRFEDEMVRHKVLDLIGDMALIGRPVRAHLIAVRCSHAMHIEMARRIEQSSRKG